MLFYALKRIARSWKLFVALILGMVLAATFFGGINVGADTIGKQALDEQLLSTPFDVRLQQSAFGSSLTANTSTFQTLALAVDRVDGVVNTEVLGDAQDSLNFSLPRINAISDSSSLYKHMVISGAAPTLPNQTLVSSTSSLAKTVKTGDSITYHLNQNGNSHYNVSLKIVGFATLDSVAANNLGGGGFRFGRPSILQQIQDVLIVSWEKTYSRIVDWAYQQNRLGTPVFGISGYADVYLDREVSFPLPT